MVTNRQQPPASTRLEVDFHRAAIGCVTQGVVEQIENGPMQPGLVSSHPCFRLSRHHQMDAPLFGEWTDAAPGVLDHVIEDQAFVIALVHRQTVLQP